ncbi:hypothetical protein GCM10010170_069970 [Dactylosporangium salmoneum]|uniref:Uncharacterized protein n=1 Tax=Dactylosporangium salmoneum TaxID=53361 RepID=A0ABN3H5F1_9ACTN
MDRMPDGYDSFSARRRCRSAAGSRMATFRRAHGDEPAGASGHHGIAVDIDTDAIDHTNLWTYR